MPGHWLQRSILFDYADFNRVLPRGVPAAGAQTPDSLLFPEILTNEMPRWITI